MLLPMRQSMLIRYKFEWLNPNDSLDEPTFENLVIKQGVATPEEYRTMFLEWKGDKRSVTAESQMIEDDD